MNLQTHLQDVTVPLPRRKIEHLFLPLISEDCKNCCTLVLNELSREMIGQGLICLYQVLVYHNLPETTSITRYCNYILYQIKFIKVIYKTDIRGINLRRRYQNVANLY